MGVGSRPVVAVVASHDPDWRSGGRGVIEDGLERSVPSHQYVSLDERGREDDVLAKPFEPDGRTTRIQQLNAVEMVLMNHNYELTLLRVLSYFRSIVCTNSWDPTRVERPVPPPTIFSP